MTRSIDYGNLMHAAMRGLIQTVLQDVAKDGLPGDHHFFISFDTLHPDVELADWLSDRFPESMTIVIQHWFDNLEVSDAGFSITLNFGNNPEPMFIPYDAIKTFVDPSVEFGLRFESQDEDEQGASADATSSISGPGTATLMPAEADAGSKAAETEPPQDADIVSLDSFRKP